MTLPSPGSNTSGIVWLWYCHSLLVTLCILITILKNNMVIHIMIYKNAHTLYPNDATQELIQGNNSTE